MAIPNHGFDKDKNIVSMTDNQQIMDRIDALTTQIIELESRLNVVESTCPIPVYGIYITSTNLNPANIWSDTTWIKFATGRCLFGWQAVYKDFTYDALTQEGGSRISTVTLTNKNIPPHQHEILYDQYSIPSGGEVTHVPSDKRLYSEWNGAADPRTPDERARYVLRSQFGYDPNTDIPENGKVILHNNPGTDLGHPMKTYTQNPYNDTSLTTAPEATKVEIAPPFVIVAIWKRTA